jgi:putative DNA primase/helicase
MLTAALAYAAHGWPIVPLHHPTERGCSCGYPDCDSPGKHPRTSRGFYDANTNTATIRDWWTKWPQANIGFKPGQARLLVVDLDGPEGEQAAAALGLLAEPTLEVVSGRAEGGRHRYYRHPGGTIENVKLAPRTLEVRADHGDVLLPPSVHPTGRVYRWVGKLDELASVPLTLAERLRAASRQQRPASSPDDPIAQGERNARLTSLAGAMRRHGCTAETIQEALLAENGRRCIPPLVDTEVERIAASVGRYVPARGGSATPQEVTPGGWPTAVRSERWRA